MFREHTYTVIRKRILDNIESDIDKREGSVTSNLISPLAEEVAKSYLAISEILGVGFIEDTFNDYLEKRTSEFGIYRKAGVNATGVITVEGVKGVVIPVGTLVKINDLEFKILDEGEINKSGSLELSVIATNIGYKYNLEEGTALEFVENIKGVTSIKVKEDFINGADVESDDELRDRFRVFINNPRTSGNIYHYQEWALECEGIGKAKVYPLWNGNGTVKVMVTGNNNRPVGQDLLEQCKAYIETQRPIGATVTVTTPTVLNVDVSIRFNLNPNCTLAEVTQEIKELLKDYIESSEKAIIYTKIFGYIANLSGVDDITEFKLNNAMANIRIEEDKIPVVNNVKVTGEIANG